MPFGAKLEQRRLKYRNSKKAEFHLHNFTFANSSRNISSDISIFIHFLCNLSVRFHGQSTAGHTNRRLKRPTFLAMYANLYDTDSHECDDLSTDEYLRNINTKILTEEQRELLDNKITTNEYFEALKYFQKNKTPGNDGLTVEFYLGFWHLIGKRLVDALNFAHEQGQLSNSQKQAMITLLEKKDKDKRFIKNWRPISLINVDVKIASKAIARRLELILPNLIHPNQNDFIKGRSILDGVRTIEDVLEFAKFTDCSGVLLAIDFEKAFDSLNHTFLLKGLENIQLWNIFSAVDQDFIH